MVASWSWSAFVAVATITVEPDSIAGTRYASVLPVPVPAWIDEMAVGADRIGDPFGHLDLAEPCLGARQRRRDLGERDRRRSMGSDGHQMSASAASSSASSKSGHGASVK